LILMQTITLIGMALDTHADVATDQSTSIGIIGGADGPTSVYIAGSKQIRLIDWLIRIFGRAGTDSKPENIEGLVAHQNVATKAQRQEAREKGLLILINKQNPIDEGYKPDDLSPIKYYATDRSEAGRYMRKEAADRFHELVEAADSEGFKIVMTTAYRSYGFQQILWNNYVANEGEAAASRFSAKPGQSEHQSGLAVDVSSPSVNYALTERFGETEEGIWLANNAHEYGFIIRFPKDKENITGYLYEPWHIRYVGQPIAEEIYSKTLTLEEYLDQYEEEN
ncbi:MAG TPA: D-alanyl-D-alanine carboxypeptidase family protein, partial [Anaerovoracaceae bacterium]|nr:D-alanyl-D-alanine carboxypeptidase family protein [Anaerovoracaceae bacterium]